MSSLGPMQRAEMPMSSGPSIRRSLAAAALLVLISASVFASFPKPSGPVNDFADILDAPTLAELKALSADVEAQTTSEIAVVTVTSLDGMSVEEYANRLFREWGIGQKAADNGVLILVAPSERKIRIEVGYGLEGVLPDGLAGQIIREEFTPQFKDGHYPQGILLGTRRVAEVVRRNHTLTADERKQLDEAKGQGAAASASGTVPRRVRRDRLRGLRQRDPAEGVFLVRVRRPVRRVAAAHVAGNQPDGVLHRGRARTPGARGGAHAQKADAPGAECAPIGLGVDGMAMGRQQLGRRLWRQFQRQFVEQRLRRRRFWRRRVERELVDRNLKRNLYYLIDISK
jgi:uncharacterized membrane protein YgcG